MTSKSRSLPFGVLLLMGAGIAAFGCGGSSGGGDSAVQVGTDGAPPSSNGGAVGGAGGQGGATAAKGGGGIVGTGGGGGVTAAQGGGGIVATGGVPGTGGSSTPACGQAGLPCCDGNTCNGGGCCVSGICMAEGGSCVGLGGGICNSGVCGTCGGPGLPCCTSSTGASVCTSPSSVCSGGNCTKCGDLGSPCCASASGGKCNAANAICNSSNLCMACGTPGGPCCAGNQCTSPSCCYENVCAGEGAACGSGGGTCQAGHCSGCGNASQPCCANTCYNGLLCKSGSCAPCGGVGETCCPSSGGASACQSGMACTSDAVCARCGSAGDICCAGNTCTDGCCQNGRCMAASACPTPDAAPTDAPVGGSGGNPGTGGVTGTGGSGGVSGTGGIVGTGGTSVPWTAPAGCGDKVVTPPERCDDGNTVPFDGCSSECQFEPKCVGSGPCTSTCGDGIVVGEECDDGNTTDGDGCSAGCKVESGFTCTQPLGDRILVPAVYRDFKFENPPDFEPGVTGSEEAATGLVKPDLDADGKPEYASPAKPPLSAAITSATTFATWYRNTDGTNHATVGQLALWNNGNGAYVNRYGANGEQWPITDNALWCGVEGSELVDADGKAIPCTYKYSSGTILTDCEEFDAAGYTRLSCTLYSGSYRALYLMANADGNPLFFPVDGDTFSSSSEKLTALIPSVPKNMYDASGTWPYESTVTGKSVTHNFSFTSEIRYWFKYEADQSYKLDIAGDDDVWVFINKKLAVDLGGIHTPVAGSVTLNDTTAATFGLEPGNVYEVAVFQAERQSESSTFKLTLAGFSLAPSQCQRN